MSRTKLKYTFGSLGSDGVWVVHTYLGRAEAREDQRRFKREGQRVTKVHKA